jgi:tetratricopeptide (TPR) repeat protein
MFHKMLGGEEDSSPKTPSPTMTSADPADSAALADTSAPEAQQVSSPESKSSSLSSMPRRNSLPTPRKNVRMMMSPAADTTHSPSADFSRINSGDSTEGSDITSISSSRSRDLSQYFSPTGKLNTLASSFSKRSLSVSSDISNVTDELSVGRPLSCQSTGSVLDAFPSTSHDSNDIDMPLLGVKFSYLAHFIKNNGGRGGCLSGMTTADVCQNIVFPMTSESKSSLCQQLNDAPDGVRWVGLAQWFISHAWSYVFLDVVEAIDRFLSKECRGSQRRIDNTVIWFDLFSNSQHATADRPFHWWTTTFKNTIGKLGNVLMIVLPWDNPVTLSRAWCLFEVLACAETNSRLAISMTESEMVRFRAQMLRGNAENVLNNMRSKIKTNESKASFGKDQVQIHYAIRHILDNGFVTLDFVVFRAMEEWIMSTLNDQIGLEENELQCARLRRCRSSLLATQGMVETAIGLAEASYDTFKADLGDEDTETLTLVNDLAMLYKHERRYEEALEKCSLCYETSRNVLGEAHINTLICWGNLALLLDCMGQHHEAERIFRSCIALSEAASERDSLPFLHNLGEFYRRHNRLSEAEPLLKESQRLSVKYLGYRNPDALASMNNLALLLMSNGDLSAAKSLLVECANYAEAALGLESTYTKTYYCNLANVYARLHDNVALDTLQRRLPFCKLHEEL